MGFGRPVWADIDLSAIRHNMQQILLHIKPGTLFCPIIKADGYGHGAVPIAHEAVALGVPYLGVATLDEAITLRDAGITIPILILGFSPPTSSPIIVGNNLTQTVYRKEHIDALSAAATALNMTVKVHIKVDTGMTRLGIPPEETAEFSAYAASQPNIILEGMFTHFAMADSHDKMHALNQFSKFQSAIQSLTAKGISIPIKHCANSAAILDLPETHLDMVRAGIILYGLWPSDEVGHPISLQPAMQLKARLSMVKKVEKNRSISYGAKFTTQEPSVIATIPIGYADGYTRMLSGKAEILINGHRAPIVGRICMDQCMVDVTHIPSVHEGQEVLLFGGSELPVEEIGRHLDTINYEVVCMVGKRVPRLYKHSS